MYKFRNSTVEERKNSQACCGQWVYGSGASERKYALFFGKVRTLFGVNDSISEDWENMYSYNITAEDEQGNKLYLEIYHGPGGPSIATPFDKELPPDYEKAKAELIELISNAEPADYEWEGVYEDVPVNIKYIVKDGVAHVESEFPEDFEM